MRAFHLSYTWDSRRPIPLETVPGPKGDLEKAQEILQNAGGESLLLSESMALLESYGYSLPRYRLVRTLEEIVQAWRDLGGPLVMKVNRPHVSHKSDSGLVRLSLDSEEDLKSAFRDFQEMVGQDLEVFLQSMVAGGREVILGGKQDHTFGPVVLFGLGGIFVEVFEDVTWRVAPINREEAQQMINATRGAKILQGLRGEKPYDIAALQDLIAKLSRILVENPRIQEIDINPLMVLPEGRGAIAVDARVILREKRGNYTGC
ncbi:MAG: acetate--CoA ligase family protein [Deltaproteobacteria bacterium]|nr:acetate--CoA ligase family protein [Deltaproteobacteria bacterium]